MSHDDLTHYYLSKGIAREHFWIGPEHPALEQLALGSLCDRDRESKLVLEIGYQAGGFAVPVIRELYDEEGFHYTGIDNLSYRNAVSGRLISDFLGEQGLSSEKYQFLVGDASEFLMATRKKFDLILIDHLKALYLRELRIIITHQLLAEGGVIILHDVLQKAADPWKKCKKLCARLGYNWELHPEINAGAAVISAKSPLPENRLQLQLNRLILCWECGFFAFARRLRSIL
ncbi:MAG: class I SAM-dependent methyltransferase [Desulfatiglandales bacterium]